MEVHRRREVVINFLLESGHETDEISFQYSDRQDNNENVDVDNGTDQFYRDMEFAMALSLRELQASNHESKS